MGQSNYPHNSQNMKKHDLLGLIEIVPSSLPQKYLKQVQMIVIKRVVESKKKYQEWQQEINDYDTQQSRDILYLPEQNTFIQNTVCSNAGTLQLRFEYYPYTLKQEITNRYHSRMLYDEADLWYLLYNLIEAAYLVEPRQKKLGDVHPCNILIDQNGRMKLLPTFAIPNTLNNYQKIVQNQMNDTFLAPEEIDLTRIKTGIYPSKINPCRAEVFSIGVTILMCATITDCYVLYDRGTLKFNSVKKDNFLREIAKTYSKYFCKVVKNLLQEDPSKRKAASCIFTQLNRFQDEILSMKKFECNFTESAAQQFQKQPSISDLLQKEAEFQPKMGRVQSKMVLSEVQLSLNLPRQ